MHHPRLFPLFLLALLAAPALAQPRDPLNPPLSPIITKLLDDETTSEAEKRRLAVFHGQWDRIKEPTLAERAAIALAKYELEDESLRDEKAPAILRAKAALYRGEPELAVKLLEADASAQGAVVKAEALEQMGKNAEAIAVLTPLRKKLSSEGFGNAAELTAAAEAIVMLARLEDRPAKDHETAMKLFARARNELDRLYWPASLAEARVLIEKDNPEDALNAIVDVLRLNPKCAEAIAMLGNFAAARFAFDEAGKAAAKLRIDYTDHPLAAIIMANVHLTQKDAEGARAAVEPMLARYPNHRELLALLAAVEALSHDEAQLNHVLTHFDKISGKNPLALVTAGGYLSHARQYPLSEKLLREAVTRQPNWSDPRTELGLMLMQAGKEEDALKELRTAAKLDPYNKRARNQLKLVEELLGYEHIALEHFVIKYRKGIDEVLARDMERELEVMFAAVTGAFEHKPAKKTLIEIMPDAEWFGVRITGLPEIWTIAACTGDVIAMTPPREGKNQRGYYDWYRVLQHEYTHTVTLDQTAYRIPHWFTEAAAVSMEPGGRDFQMTSLLAQAYHANKLFNLHSINWGFIRPRTPTDRPLAYAQAHWMIQYITEKFGHQSVLDMLKLYRAGTPETKAITQVIGQDADEFMTGFKAWAGKQVEAWGFGERKDDQIVFTKLAEAKATGRLDRAFATKLMKDHPDHPDALRVAAEAALDATIRDPELTREIVQRYAALRPVDVWPHEALYELALEDGRVDDAIASLNELDRVESTSGKFAHKLAELYRKQGNFAQAARTIHRALHRQPYDPGYRELAAAIMVQNKDFPAAAHHIRALTILEPDRAMHFVRLAALYDMSGDKAKAKGAAEAARKIDPKAAVDRFLQ